MIINKTFLTFLFFILITKSNAQVAADNNLNASKIDTISYIKKNEKFYFREKKMFPSDLKPLLTKFNSSGFEFKKYQKNHTPAMIILLTGFTSGVIALARQNKEKNFFTPYSIILFTGNLIGIPLIISARKHLRKSATLYNKEVRGL